MPLYQIQFEKLTCDWDIQYFTPEPQPDLDIKILRYIESFSDQISRFDPHSLLSRLNEKRTLRVNRLFLDLLERSLYFNDLTNGVFNPLASPAHIGYRQSFYEEDFESPIDTLINLNLQELKVEDNQVSLAPGQILDFGGLGKGYLVDQLVSFLHGVSNHFLINAGGDIYAFGGKPDGQPWTVAIEAPNQETLEEPVISVVTGGVASSGTYKRHWGNQKHHIVDPTQSDSAQTDHQRVTVLTSDCTTADALATSLIIMGKASGQTLAEKMGLSVWFSPS